MDFRAESTGRHLRLKYGAVGYIKAMGGMSIKTSREVRRKLVTEATLEDLRDFRAGITSQVKFSQQITLSLTIVSFVLTLLFSPVIFYLQQSLKVADWQHQYIFEIHKEVVQSLNTDEKIAYLKKAMAQESNGYNEQLHLLEEHHLNSLASIVVPTACIFALLIYRNKWLYSVEQCVIEAFEEKKELIEKEKERKEKAMKERKEASRRL
ncbi:hypothetical protein [Paenibacillus polymyxa]|uniref:Uncharacterized protein n=1 Tax=Paenibacillus polymyxa TaxID=1406 RepID=A0AAP4EA96_PAEPO|nr:hypothetical protein [Paenibacillus polymyxa]MDH2330471.1 hypothetical protein [Paenibacillus polymyxa]